MAQVTVELRHLLETDFELFDFDYEFDDRKMAKELEQAVIDHYYNYEIGQETPDDFKRVFKRRWLSAISYYNKLHNTTLLEYNPLINYSMTEALEQLRASNRAEESTGNVEASSNTSSESNEKVSDYPQQPIAGGDYLAGERKTTTNSTTEDGTTSTNTSTIDDEENTSYEKTIEGLTGKTYQELIQLERENILRISQMLIEELKPCFILVY